MEGRYNFQSFGVHPIFLHAQGKHLEHMIWWMHSVCLHVEVNYEYIQLMWNLHSICHTCMIPLDGILFSFKHEVYVSMVIFKCHICLWWSRLICRKEPVMRKVTVRMKSGCDKNDRWGYVETYQVVTLLGTAKELYCANHCRKNLNLPSWP